jgi:hypothetical protein
MMVKVLALVAGAATVNAYTLVSLRYTPRLEC